MSAAQIIETCLLSLLAMQAGYVVGMGTLTLLGYRLRERPAANAVHFIYVGSFCLGLLATLTLLLSGMPRVVFTFGQWELVPGFVFRFLLQLDHLSAPFLLLGTALCAVVGAFSERYLHREAGYFRFFWMLCLFGLGYCLTILAGSIEVLYGSWELIGLSSALLISFFHERPGPVHNGLYAFAVYRICDLGLVLASVFVYQEFHTGEFQALVGDGVWPHQHSPLALPTATLIGAFLLLAACGKAAQVPFSGWLPRAMEGPTPSTAIFYGALSVHAGAYLLLRCSSVLDASPYVSAAVVLVGLLTAFTARSVGQVQADIKCSLAYASLAQLGLIFAEIGLGFRWLPVLHALGHITLRSIQFLKAPSLLHEIHELHSALGDFQVWRPAGTRPSGWKAWLFRASVERFYLDALVERLALRPLFRLAAVLRGVDRAVIDALVGPFEGGERK